MDDKPYRTGEFEIADLLAPRARPQDFAPARGRVPVWVYVVLVVLAVVLVVTLVLRATRSQADVGGPRSPLIAAGIPTAAARPSTQSSGSEVDSPAALAALALQPVPEVFEYLSPRQWLDVAVNPHRHLGRGLVLHGVVRGNDGRVVLVRVDAQGFNDAADYVVDAVLNSTPSQLPDIRVGEQFDAGVVVQGLLQDGSCLPVFQLVDFSSHDIRGGS